MQQVLLRIPLNGRPFGLPLCVVLLALFLVTAAALYGLARFAPCWKLDPKSVQGAAVWVAVAGLIVGALSYFFAADGLPIYGFGMMLFLAFVVCNWLAGRRAVSEGVPKEAVQDLAIWLIVGGLIGARLTSILTSDNPNPPTNLGDFLYQFIRIWDGGIVLYGAVIGGTLSYVVAYFLVFRKQGLSTLKLADIIAPPLAVGLCLGRIGCFLNGCCYGQVACTDCPIYPVSFPLSAWSRYELVNDGYQTAAGFTVDPIPDLEGGGGAVVKYVEPQSAAATARDPNSGERTGLRPGDVILQADDKPIAQPADLDDYLKVGGSLPRGKNDLTLLVRSGAREHSLVFTPWTLGLHPTQLYESVSMILLFLLLTAYYPFRRHDGQVMALLMICYAVHRSLNELLRADKRPYGFESWTSIVLLAAGAALWIWLQTRPAQYRFQWSESAAAPAKPTTASQAVRPASS